MTIKELLYREMHGEKNLRIQEVKKEVETCIDEDFDFFLGTKRVSNILEGVNTDLPYMNGINKAVGFLKVYEDRILSERKVTPLTAKLLLHDIMMGLNESINTLENSVLFYNRADKEKLAKVYSTILFEAQKIGLDNKVEVDDLRVKNKELQDLIEEDFFTISEEVF